MALTRDEAAELERLAPLSVYYGGAVEVHASVGPDRCPDDCPYCSGTREVGAA